MRKLSLLLVAFTTTLFSFGQSPQKMSYQSVIRNTNNQLVTSQQVGMRISILQGSVTGTTVYTETISPTTNANGLVTFEIGNAAGFNTINWANGTYFIKTETDPTGGTNYTITGVSQLLSVPYALHSKTAETLTEGIVETDPVFVSWDKSTGITITESQISNLQDYLTAETDPAYNASTAAGITQADTASWNAKLSSFTETDPAFSAWDKSTGISITESQISNLQDYLTAETDPVFTAWDKSTGISITESQISNLQNYLTAETDPAFNASTAAGITQADTASWNAKLSSFTETDPAFTAWDKSTGISITESQISNLQNYLTGEIDPTFAQNFEFSAAQGGALLIYNAVEQKWKPLQPGSEGQILTFSGNAPQWTTPVSPGLATVETIEATGITTNTANVVSNVISEGGYAVTERGILWGTSPNLNINDDNKITNGISSGQYITEITGLNHSSTYYVRAYAQNAAGTAYANEISFQTATFPTITTTAISNITATTATSGGNVTADGGATVTARGVCYATTQNPTTANSTVASGTGTGSFTSNLTNLQSGTVYYVRAYATNSVGTIYGQQRTFTTPMPDGPGNTITDADGNTYNTVWINNRQWMKENLKSTKYRDGTNIPNVTDNGTWAGLSTPAYCWYNNNIANKPTYGALYNWYAVNTGNLCPTGWHVPTDAEWYAMENYVDPTINDPNATSWRGTNGGTKLKTTSGWSNDGNGTDNYGFSAFPGGVRTSMGSFIEMSNFGYWWSSTQFDATQTYARGIYYFYGSIIRGYDSKRLGLSVRCVRDN